MQVEVLQPAYVYHTTTAKPQRNTNTHRTRAIQPMKFHEYQKGVHLRKFYKYIRYGNLIPMFWRFADRASQYIYLRIYQLDAKFLFYNKYISCLYMFRAHVLEIM